VLNNILEFHEANGQDVMHVMLEGALPLEIKLMLRVFIYDKKYFGLDLLNDRLDSFVYGRNEARTKPPKSLQIFAESNLGLSS